MDVFLAGRACREAVELGSQIRGRALGTGAGRSDPQLCHYLRKAFPDAE